MTAPAQILANAFADDPFTVYVEPDRERRTHWLPWLMNGWLRACRRNGWVDAVDGAVAGWMAPGRHGFGPLTFVRSGMLGAPLRMGIGATRRMLAVESDLERAPADAHDPHAWYLLAIGVDPAFQGKGLSRELIERGVARADAEGRPVRFETNNERNVALYEHLGFELVGHLDTPGLIPQWLFRREPGTARDRES